MVYMDAYHGLCICNMNYIYPMNCKMLLAVAMCQLLFLWHCCHQKHIAFVVL